MFEDKVAAYCRDYNRAGPQAWQADEEEWMDFSELLFSRGVKFRVAFVPAWGRKIILSAWVDGSLVYDRKAEMA